jgi:hypothetical protein
MPLVTYGEMLLIIAGCKNIICQWLNILQRLQSFTKYWLLNRRENNGYKGLAFRYNSYLITDFLAGGVENSSTNLTSQNALLREI